MAIYDSIGDNYNTTRKADAFIVRQIKDLLAPKEELDYIDIGCGTGNYTIALAECGIRIQGLDPSDTMLAKARAKNSQMNWTIGSAEKLPFGNSYFSGAIAILTIHHWQNLEQSFNEIYRVLKPGSNLVIFTAIPGQMQNYWLNHYFPVMMQKSIEQMPALDAIIVAAYNAGFKFLLNTPYAIKPDLQDLFLYSGKHDPALYLDATVRQNISSFASLASKEELAAGISKLSYDIATGRFEVVRSMFDRDKGDYSFLKLARP